VRTSKELKSLKRLKILEERFPLEKEKYLALYPQHREALEAELEGKTPEEGLYLIGQHFAARKAEAEVSEFIQQHPLEEPTIKSLNRKQGFEAAFHYVHARNEKIATKQYNKDNAPEPRKRGKSRGRRHRLGIRIPLPGPFSFRVR
jgi:hypothetical protein